MVSVVIGIDGQRVVRAQDVPSRARAPKMRIIDHTGRLVFTPPFAPKVVTYSGFVREKNQQQRAVGAPFLVPSAGSLRKMGFTMLVARKSIQQSVEDYLDLLEAMAHNDGRYLIVYSKRERGVVFRISDFTIETTERNTLNQVSRATVTMEFTEDNTPNYKPTAVPIEGRIDEYDISVDRQGGQTARTHVLVEGQSLRSVAQTYYTDPQAWRRIALENGISDMSKMQVGQILVLP